MWITSQSPGQVSHSSIVLLLLLRRRKLLLR
jgi:hypothetical protein